MRALADDTDVFCCCCCRKMSENPDRTTRLFTMLTFRRHHRMVFRDAKYSTAISLARAFVDTRRPSVQARSARPVLCCTSQAFAPKILIETWFVIARVYSPVHSVSENDRV